MTSHYSRATQQVKNFLVHRMGLTQIAGPQLEDAMRICRVIANGGWLSTVGPWFSGDESVKRVLQDCLQILRAMSNEWLPCQLSIKPTNLAYDEVLLRELLAVAREGGMSVQLDSTDVASAAWSFSMLERARREYSNIGCTLPARWARSVADAERVVEMQIPVRIVKGQWSDPSMQEYDYRRGFLELVDRLAGRAVRIAVATHDRHLAQEALRRVKRAGTPGELEQMFGMPLVLRTPGTSFDTPVRVYVPFGNPYLPYNVSDIWNRPAIWSWMLRDLLLTRGSKLEKLGRVLATKNWGGTTSGSDDGDGFRRPMTLKDYVVKKNGERSWLNKLYGDRVGNADV